MWKKLFFCALLLFASLACADPVKIVAAENFYGGVAEIMGKEHVQVKSVMTNPNEDPDIFSPSDASVGQAVADADIVVYNGLDYDAWMEKLIESNSNKKAMVIVVADLIGKKRGDNRHLWYIPTTMPIYAKAVVAKLCVLQPENKAFFAAQLKKFNDDYQPFLDLVAEIKKTYQGTPVICTETVFTNMSDALGLKMYGEGFQISQMNDVEPSAKDIIDFESKLTSHAVKVLIYNRSVSNPQAERMRTIAKQQGIPVVEIYEIQPPGKTYLEWMMSQLIALQKALAKG